MLKTSRKTGLKKGKIVGAALGYVFDYEYYEGHAHRAECIGTRYYRYDGNGNVTAEREGGHAEEGVFKREVQSPLYLSNPAGGRKGAYFVDYHRKNSLGQTEFYEIKPVSYMANTKGDNQLKRYIDRAHANGDTSVVHGTEILAEIDGMVIDTNIMSDNILDFSGKITLKTDPANHPGMIFYFLDDGKTESEKIKDILKKVGTVAIAFGLFFATQGGYTGQPVLLPVIS
ncbi:MAG: hypothetical protein LBK08_03170 [Treponema sp.]|jgi:hypothetical protein|nr:hypothetical protein [Treponema sp.]